MIFFRSVKNPGGKARSLTSVRWLVAMTLTFYPAGTLLRVFGPEGAAADGIGLLLILVSAIGFGLLAGTRFNRITGEQLPELDEYERKLRAGAMETAFQLFAALVLVGIIYMALASSKGWWLPQTYDQWNGLFWGAFLYASLLPTAVLTFRLRDEEEEVA